jgi:cysteinyl-tRNA synthetase
MSTSPGYVSLFGSDETSASGRKIYEWLVQRLPPPIRAKVRHDWATADDLRERITRLGWQILDTPQGPRLQTAAPGTKESFTGSKTSR